MKTYNEMRELFERSVEQDRTRKPSTKKYIRECLLYATRSWPDVESKDIGEITKFNCIEWASKWQKYSDGRYNGIIQRVRAVFTLAVDLDLIAKNPMLAVKQMSVRIKPPKLPSQEQFRKVITYLESSPYSKRAVPLIKFLVFSGMRIGEARRLTRDDITDYGIRIEEQKNGETSYAPILPGMAELIKTLPKEGPLFRIKNPRKALANACDAAGIPHMTNHHLRHMFSTRCLECGVDIKTVAFWLRHKDGGALALKRYSHVRNEHAQKMASMVQF